MNTSIITQERTGYKGRTSLYTIAWDYRFNHNFSVVPVPLGEKYPSIEWKEYQQKRPTQEELAKWFSNDNINIAIVTGSISGVAVLDVDGEEGERSIRENHLYIPPTPTVKTGRGFHYYFKYGGGIKNTVKLYAGVDVRGEGGIVVAPPSLHQLGVKYKWVIPLEEIELAELPDWLLKQLQEKESTIKIYPDGWVDELLEGVEAGRRHDTLTKLAGHYIAKGLGLTEIEKILLDWNRKNKPPMESEEVVKTVESIFRKDREKEEKEEKREIAGGVRLTEFYNADRFVEAWKGKVLYCKPWDCWLIYKDGRWQKDNIEEVLALAKKVVLSYYGQAEKIEDDNERKALIKWALKSETKTALNNMIDLARHDLAVLPEEFDKDLYLLNLKNGTYDLIADTLLAHNPEHLLSQMADVEFNSNAECPKWLEFLNTIFKGNQDLINFIQKAVGYSLSGDTGEDCFFILYGTGMNGKSTFLNTIQTILGDYAIQARAETFLSKDRDYIPNDIARMNKKRLVIATEFPEGKRVNENLIKSLTGRDTISARFLRQEFFDFSPTFKLWIGTNHKPVVYENTIAFWRRVKLIPFEVQIPEEQRIPHYEDILLQERSGILNWALEGFRRWKREGLGTTDKITEAVKAYREDMDILEEFIQEKCMEGAEYSVSFSELYSAYSQWANENKEQLLSKQTLGRRLEERGYKPYKSVGKRVWRGLKLK